MKKFLALFLSACMLASTCFITGLVASAEDAAFQDYYYVKGSTSQDSNGYINHDALTYNGSDNITFEFQLLKTSARYDESGLPSLTDVADGTPVSVEGVQFNYKVFCDQPSETLAPSQGKNLYSNYPVQSSGYNGSAILAVDSNPNGDCVTLNDDVKAIISKSGYAGYVYLVVDYLIPNGVDQDNQPAFIHRDYFASIAINFDGIQKTVSAPDNFETYWQTQRADLGVATASNLNVVTAIDENAAATFTQYVGHEENLANYKAYWAAQNKADGVTAVITDVTQTVNGLTDDQRVNFKVYDVKIETKGTIYKSDRETGEVTPDGGLPVSGYVAIPNKATTGTCGLDVEYMGYGIASATLPKDYNDNTITAVFNNNGMPNGLSGADYAAIRNDYPDQTCEFDDFLNQNANTAYYNSTVRRVVRSLQYLESLSQWKTGNAITVHGPSYGGFQTVAAAALDHNVTQCNPEIAWMCNVGSSDYGCVGSTLLPNYSTDYVRVFKDNGLVDMDLSYLNLYDSYTKFATNDSAYDIHKENGEFKTLSQNTSLLYFDTTNFASLISANCNVLMRDAGLGDDICPSYGETVLYNTLKAKIDAGTLKGLSAYFYQDGRHGKSPSYAWFRKDETQTNNYMSVKTNIPGVTFENNVATIGKDADCDIFNTDLFKANAKLFTLNINIPVDTIRHEGLRDCVNLSSVNFGEGAYVKEIEASAFMYDYKLTSMELPVGLEKLGGYALQATGIKDLTIPGAAVGKTITYPLGCVDNISNLKTLTINDNLANTDASAVIWDTNALPVWQDFSSLKVSVNESSPLFTKIYEANNFDGRKAESRYSINADAITYENGVLTLGSAICSIDSSRLNSIIGSTEEDLNRLTKLVIDGAGLTIVHDTFQNCHNLTRLEFKNGGYIKELGTSAFINCNLDEIVFPEGLKTISENAFNGCGAKLVSFPKGNFDFAGNTITGLPNMTQLIFRGTKADGSAYSFASNTFGWGINSTSVTIDENLDGYTQLNTINNTNYFNKFAFNVNMHVEGTTLVITGDCKPVQKDVTILCANRNVTEVLFREGDVILSKEVFSGVPTLSKLSYENGCIKSTEGDNLFTGTAITNAVFGEGLESLEANILNASNVTSVTLPESYTKIQGAIFSLAPQLTSINIKAKNIESIDGNAFAYTAYTNPVTVTVASSTAAKMVVSAVANSKSWTDSVGKVVYEDGLDVTNFTYNNDYTTLTAYTGEAKDVNIPYGITVIGEGAFADNATVETVNFSQTVKEIHNAAFKGTSSLKELNLNDGLETIGAYVLSDGNLSRSIEFLEIPASVTSIGAWSLATVKNVKINNDTLALDSGMFFGPTAKIIANGSSQAHTYAKDNLIKFEYINASEVLKGDINDDRAVNVKDLVRLKKYEVDPQTTYVLDQALDVNNDTVKNVEDLVALRKVLLAAN